MITYLELVFVFIIAILFVILFKIQKKIFPQNYFSSSQVILDKNVTYKMLVVRYLLILFFSFAFNLIIENRSIIAIGVFLGSFLIIWPTLLNPSEPYWAIGYVKKKDILIIYFLHFLFVLSSVLTTYFGTILFPLVKDLYFEYKSDLIYDLAKYFLGSVFWLPFLKKGNDYLNKNIANNRPSDTDA